MAKLPSGHSAEELGYKQQHNVSLDASFSRIPLLLVAGFVDGCGWGVRFGIGETGQHSDLGFDAEVGLDIGP
ncbi:hypothetical protein GQ649_28600 [Rhodococcus sp. DSM 6344]|nr:hypothetical protein [Rhodococcus erythropolis]